MLSPPTLSRLRTQASHLKSGFTLIELSIVLVIIGLLVGGIFVGKELITQAAIRSQISQIQEFNSAVNVFRIKYDCKPGDCYRAPQYGFVTRAGSASRGDGNGIITSTGLNYEYILFWRDLSDAGLIPYTLQGTDASYTPSATVLVSSFLPTAKVDSGSAVMAYSGGYGLSATLTSLDGNDYFAIVSQGAFGAGGLNASTRL